MSPHIRCQPNENVTSETTASRCCVNPAYALCLRPLQGSAGVTAVRTIVVVVGGGSVALWNFIFVRTNDTLTNRQNLQQQNCC